MTGEILKKEDLFNYYNGDKELRQTITLEDASDLAIGDGLIRGSETYITSVNGNEISVVYSSSSVSDESNESDLKPFQTSDTIRTFPMEDRDLENKETTDRYINSVGAATAVLVSRDSQAKPTFTTTGANAVTDKQATFWNLFTYFPRNEGETITFTGNRGGGNVETFTITQREDNKTYQELLGELAAAFVENVGNDLAAPTIENNRKVPGKYAWSKPKFSLEAGT